MKSSAPPKYRQPARTAQDESDEKRLTLLYRKPVCIQTPVPFRLWRKVNRGLLLVRNYPVAPTAQAPAGGRAAQRRPVPVRPACTTRAIRERSAKIPGLVSGSPAKPAKSAALPGSMVCQQMALRRCLLAALQVELASLGVCQHHPTSWCDVTAIIDDTGTECFEPDQFLRLGAVRDDVEMDTVLAMLALGDIHEDQPGARRGRSTNDPEGPWQVNASTLAGVDDHFWDWALWLRSKLASGRHDLVAAELRKLHEHLLRPMEVTVAPASLGEAVTAYRSARTKYERRLGSYVSRDAENTVIAVLRRRRERGSP